MPWFVERRSGEFCVVKGKRGQDGNTTVKCHPSQKAADAHLKALYAAEPGAANMAVPTTGDLEGVEILRPGRFNGVRFTAADLKGIADAFDLTHDDLPPRLQLGHDLRQRYAQALFGDDAAGADGLPALGWVRRLWVKGDRLLADIADVPAELIDLVRSGAYRARSGGLLRDVQVKGRVLPWVLDHVALLGEQPPAVPGMADVELDRDGLVYAGSVTFAYTDGEVVTMAEDAGTQVERELLAIEASLANLADRIDTLTKGKKGNPLIKARIRGLREELRRAVKLGLAQEGVELADMPGTTPPGAEPGEPTAAGPTPTTADQLATMIATLLGVGLEDYAGMWSAVKSALDASAGAGAMEGGDIGMAKDETPASEPAKADLARDDLVTENTALQARVAALELAAQTAQAEARVDHDIGQRSLPVGVRPVLVKLALEKQDDLYKSVIENAQTVPTKERGTTAGVNLAAVTLTEIERQAALDNGYDPEAVAKWKAEHANG